MKEIIAIRGATTVEENSATAISSASIELYRELMRRNNLSTDDLISVMISSTADITDSYPAKYIRELGCTAPIFSCMEPCIQGALPYCIRLLVTARGLQQAFPVYLREAIRLRPDLT